MLNFETFKKFAHENQAKLTENKLFLENNHTVNDINFNKWISKHQIVGDALYGEYLKDNSLAQYLKGAEFMNYLGQCAIDFRKVTRHVSFSEYSEKIGRLAVDIREQCLKNNYTNVCLLFLNYELVSHKKPQTKSNFWVGMLLYYLLSDLIKGVYINLPDQFTDEKQFLNNESKTLFIIPDDVSYTGKQMRDGLTHFFAHSRLDPTHVPTPERPYSHGFIHFKQNVDFYIAIPMMSRDALNLLQRTCTQIEEIYKNPKRLNSLETGISIKFIFSNYQDDCIFENIMSSLIKNNNNSVEQGNMKLWNIILSIRGENIFAIYFDHKLADRVSIFQQIYAIGRSLHPQLCNDDPENSYNFYYNLINNCDYKYLSCHYINILDIKDIVGDTFICPRPFYKFFQYVFNGKQFYNFKDIDGMIENTYKFTNYKAVEKYINEQNA